MSTYYVGGLRRIKTTFVDVTGAPIDPAILKFHYTPPSGTEVILTYGVEPAVVKESDGVYHVDLSLTEAGPWKYKWVSTGTGQAARYGEFFVESYTKQPWALVSLEKAKRRLKYEISDTSHDDDVIQMMTEASSIIMDYLKLASVPSTWTTTQGYVVEACVLEVLGELDKNRSAGEVNLISSGIERALARLRDPALA